MSVPLGAATASAGVVMPTVSRPTMPMTPTENDVAVTRLNDAPRLRRGRDVRRRLSGSVGARVGLVVAAVGDWIGRLAREGEQSRGGLEFVDLGCRRLAAAARRPARLGRPRRRSARSGSAIGRLADVDDRLEQLERLDGHLTRCRAAAPDDGLGAAAGVGVDAGVASRRRRRSRRAGATGQRRASRIGGRRSVDSGRTAGAVRPERPRRTRQRDPRRTQTARRPRRRRALRHPAARSAREAPASLRGRRERRGGCSAGTPRGRRLSLGASKGKAQGALGSCRSGGNGRTSGFGSPSPFGRRR